MESPRSSICSSSISSDGDGEISEDGTISVPTTPQPMPIVSVDSMVVKPGATGVLHGNVNTFTVNVLVTKGDVDAGNVNVGELTTDAVKINSETCKTFFPHDYNSFSKLDGTKEDLERLRKRWYFLIASLVVLSIITLLGTAVLSLTSWKSQDKKGTAYPSTTSEPTTLSPEETLILGLAGPLQIVVRNSWVAMPAGRKERNTVPAERVVVGETRTDPCRTNGECVETVRTLQMVDFERHGLSDIRYNFLIGGDGDVYWGRGFDVIGDVTDGCDNGTVSVAFIGSFARECPSASQVSAFDQLIDVGVRAGKISVAEMPGGPRIVTRSQWLAAPPTDNSSNTLPVTMVVVCHTATENCTSGPECIYRVQSIQRFHQDSRKWGDIAYNFLIGGDGQVYWGRGFDVMGAHTKGYNNGTIGVAFIGTFIQRMPDEIQIEAFNKLMYVGVEAGKIWRNYSLVAQCQIQVTAAPGLALTRNMTSWFHFDSTRPIRCTTA